MRTTIFSRCVIAVLIAFLCLILSIERSDHSNENDREIGFPFELKEHRSSPPSMWSADVLLTPKHYSKSNLDKLFLWYAKKHPDKGEMISITVYTDPEQLRLYRENADDEATNFGDRPHKLKYRSPPWDAICWRQGDGLASGGGHNLWYSYRPDLNIANLQKRIVLRGRDYFTDEKITETFEVANNNLKIKIIAYDLLMNTEPSSKYYTFSSLRGGEGDLKTVFTVRLDQPVPIPREQVEIINDRVTTMFMGWMYAVTVDRGKGWDIWDGELELGDWQCCDPTLIQNVKIFPDGVGKMTIKLSPQKYSTLHTNDYGVHWNKE
ncbi:MAG: hypothetical protein ACREEM_29115 [Blastocatellia bacterium]